MSDAHALKADGEPELESLPADLSPISQDDGLAISLNADISEGDTEQEIHSSSSAEEDEYGAVEDRNDAETERTQEINRQELEDGDPESKAALQTVGFMIRAATKLSPDQHHDLACVDEERDDLTLSQASTETSPLSSPKPRKASSVPSSPASAHNRHRSLSLLSITPTPTPLSTSPTQPLSAFTALRPSHSRQNSTHSSFSAKSGMFRQNSRPRARQNSHPDLQALLDSYDRSPSQHTAVLWRTDLSDPEGSESDPDSKQVTSGESQDSSYGF